jgi:hypothetical protein
MIQSRCDDPDELIRQPEFIYFVYHQNPCEDMSVLVIVMNHELSEH